MYQTFFTDTIQSRYIKSFLSSTPIPIYNCVSDRSYIIAGMYYIYQTSVIKCTKSGYILCSQTSFEYKLTPSNSLFPDDSLFPDGDYAEEIGEYEVISSYLFGDTDPQITHTYDSNYHYYDTETHRVLGNFLRTLKHNLSIDLMPLYNCYGQKTIMDVRLTTKLYDPQESESDLSGYKFSSDDKYTVYAIPIKFNETYTIAINSPFEVLMKSFIYGNYGVVKDSTNIGEYIQDLMIESKTGSQKSLKFNNLQYNEPVQYCITNQEQDAINRLRLKDNDDEKVYTTEEIDSEMRRIQNYEDNLYLFIQLDSSVHSSITVLEGKYRNFGDFKTRHLRYPNEYMHPRQSIQWIDEYRDKVTGSLSPSNMNAQIISNLGLLQADTKVSYAFTNKLMEYLLLNVIDTQDDISQNVIRVQEKVSYMESRGVFDETLRALLFYSYMGYNPKFGTEIIVEFKVSEKSSTQSINLHSSEYCKEEKYSSKLSTLKYFDFQNLSRVYPISGGKDLLVNTDYVYDSSTYTLTFLNLWDSYSPGQALTFVVVASIGRSQIINTFDYYSDKKLYGNTKDAYPNIRYNSDIDILGYVDHNIEAYLTQGSDYQ